MTQRSYDIHSNAQPELNRVFKMIQADISHAKGQVTQLQAQVLGSPSVASTVATGIPSYITLTGDVIGTGSGTIPTTVVAKALEQTGIWYDTVNLVYETTLSYNVSTRTLTITPTGASYRVYLNGLVSTFAGAQTISHAATQGLWYIYYNLAGALIASQTQWDLLATAPVALIYYDATTPDYWLFDERHHFDTPVEWHQSQHYAIGTFIKLPATDFVISGYTLGTDTDAAVQWAMTTGYAVDEDIENLCSAIASGGPYQTAYKSGAAGNFIRSQGVLPYVYAGGGYIYYNQFTGAVWQLTQMTSAHRVNYYIFGTTGAESTKQLIIVPGENFYTTLAEAQAESVTSLNLTGFPALEFVPLYQITFHTLSGYSHNGKCEIEAVTKIFNSRVPLSIAAPTFTNPMNTLGDIIAGGAGGAPTRIAGNITTTNNFLVQTGSGAASALPSWGTITSADLTTALTTPPAIGGSTPAAGAFTTVTASGVISSGSATKALTLSSTATGIFVGSSDGDYPFLGYNVNPTAVVGSYTYAYTDTAYIINYGGSGAMTFLGAASGTAGNAISFTSMLSLTTTTATFAGSLTVAGGVAITVNTASTSTTTGALVVTGGVGVGGALYAGIVAATNAFKFPNLIPNSTGTNVIVNHASTVGQVNTGWIQILIASTVYYIPFWA